MVGRKV